MFRLVITLLAAAVLLTTPLTAQPRSLRVAPAPNTRFALEVEKTGLQKGKKHLFLFERYSGVLAMDVQFPERSKMELEIESRSAVLKDDWVDAGDVKKIMDLTQMDMLDSAKYPRIRFVSTAVTAAPNGHFTVQGNLTIRNITNPVTVAVVHKGNEVFEGTATVKLTDYKLKPPSALLGAIGTKNEMTVSFTLKAGV
jgi:polyisoprenoid-binding protein YceI